MSVIGREWSSDVFTFWGLTYLLRDLIGILNPFIFLLSFLAQKSYKIIATKHCAVTLYNYIYTLCVISELFNNHWSWGSEYLSASLKSANSTTLPLSAIPFSQILKLDSRLQQLLLYPLFCSPKLSFIDFLHKHGFYQMA